MRTRSVLALAIFACTTTACRRAPTAASTTPPSNAVAATSYEADAADDLAFLQVDSEMVFGIDAVGLRRSALWAQYEPQLVAAIGPQLAKVRDACGFDPLKSIERVTMGGKLLEGDKFDGIIVLRGVPGKQLVDCMSKQPGELKITMDRNVMLAQHGDDKMAIAVVGSTTLVWQMSRNASRASLEYALASRVPLRSSPAFMALYDRREQGASMWGMINGNSKALAPLAQTGVSTKSIDGTLTITDKFTAAMRMTMNDAAAADGLVKSISPMSGQVRAFVEAFDIKAKDNVVQIDAVVTEAQVRALVGMAGVFGP